MIAFDGDVPDLAPPFHLIGGRVIYWRGQAGAYLLIGKGAHRISLFVFPADAVPHAIASHAGMTIDVWHARGLRTSPLRTSRRTTCGRCVRRSGAIDYLLPVTGRTS